jgi:hypothetical protein
LQAFRKFLGPYGAVARVGGNDALQSGRPSVTPVKSVREALDLMADARDGFATGYRAMLDAVLGHGLPAAICTIYEPALLNPISAGSPMLPLPAATMSFSVRRSRGVCRTSISGWSVVR